MPNHNISKAIIERQVINKLYLNLEVITILLSIIKNGM